MISRVYFLCCFIIAIKASVAGEDDKYVIRSALSPLLAFAIQPDNSTEGSYLRLQPLNGTSGQLWKLVYQFEPGLFKIEHNSGYRLSGKDDYFAYVHLHDTSYDNYLPDVWAIHSDGHIVNVFHDLHLSVYEPNANSINKHSLILEEENGESLAQKFYFIKSRV